MILHLPPNLHITGRFIKLFLSCSLVILSLLISTNAIAQCIPAPAVNAVGNQMVCNAALTTAINFTGTAATFNWVNNTPSVGLAASGMGNIPAFTAVNTTAAAVTATITVTPVTGICTGTPVSFTITVNPSPAIAVTPTTSCGGVTGGNGPCNPITASGAGSYTWSPTIGLYTDCAGNIPYTGGNLSTVYASPLSNTTYTVNGVSPGTGCSASTTSQVNFTPLSPFVTPNPAFVCVGSAPIKLKVSDPGTTVSFCSPQVNVPVADNDPAGATNTILVTGLPVVPVASATVTINMAHTRISDMVFVLKAPNGSILNLDYRISGTANTSAGPGFVNTIFSSNGTASLSTGTNPYTASFRADGYTSGGPLGAAGPTGMLPTTNNFAQLLPVVNGNWTLGFYDAATGETGILNSWCLSFTYTFGQAPNPSVSQAVWSPGIGLFMDPAATIPYVAGTALDSVWFWRNIPGTYTYQAVTKNTSSNCFSQPRNVIVTVNAATSITIQPVDQNICLGNDAHFSVVTSNGLNYQWQVTVNGGATFTNLINSGPYSGVNSANLTITQPPISMDGYRFRVLINGNAACATVLSSAAVLTVNPLPAVSFYPAPYRKLLPGLTTTLYAVVTPNTISSYTWWHDGIAVPGATASTLLVDFANIGLYKLSVTDVNGCSNFSDTISIRDSALGIVFMYPNPSTGHFQLRVYSEPNQIVPLQVNVYNNMGTKVLTQPFTQNRSYQPIDIDTRRYGKGVYWVELLGKDEKRISISRILLQ